MKILLTVAGVVIAAIVLSIGIAIVIGYSLPQSHTASHSIRLNRPPSEVYSTIRNFGASPAWRSDLQSVEMLGTSPDGHLRFRENGSNGAVTYEMLDDVPNERIVTRIVELDLGYTGTWTYTFSPSTEGATTVKITENGEVPNPLFRFLSRYVFGHTATMDSYLTALAEHFGQAANIKDANNSTE
jgi:uncharacterized membrane protein